MYFHSLITLLHPERKISSGFSRRKLHLMFNISSNFGDGTVNFLLVFPHDDQKFIWNAFNQHVKLPISYSFKYLIEGNCGQHLVGKLVNCALEFEHVSI